MIALLVFIVGVLFVLAVVALVMDAMHRTPAEKLTAEERARLVVGQRAVRQLDAITTDRTLIGDEEWHKINQRILADWYGTK